MPITDYKVTDAERNVVYVQAQADTLSGTAAQNKAVFDAYPELVRDNLDGLCDFLANMSFTHTVDTAAATASKTAISYFIPVGAIVEIIFTNGNTSATPTIAIDGVLHTISGMPTVAKLSNSENQTYRFRKASTSLVLLAYPDYVCEYGTDGEWKYARYASGKCLAWGKITGIAITSSGSFGSGGLYLHNGTFSMPSGLFNAEPEPYCSYSQSTVTGGIFVYSTSASAGGVQLLRSNNTGTNIGVPMHVIGTWR